MANIIANRSLTAKSKKILISIMAAVLSLAIAFGVSIPFLFRAEKTAEVKQTNAERMTSVSELTFEKPEYKKSVNAQIGASTSTLNNLFLYNPDGTVMPAANNHMHFQMTYTYRPYDMAGAISSTFYTYNYVCEQQTFGSGVISNIVRYPDDANPMFELEYIPPTDNGVTFGLKITINKMPIAGDGYFQLRYFAHAGAYDANNHCGYKDSCGLTELPESHNGFANKYTDFNCAYGLYEKDTVVKRQAININVEATSAPVITTNHTDAGGYIMYSSPNSAFETSEYSVPAAEADDSIIINPSTFATRNGDASLYSFTDGASDLSVQISELYSDEQSEEKISSNAFDITDYFDVSYVSYVTDAKSSLLLGGVSVSVPTASTDNTLLTTGTVDYPVFAKNALALKLTKKNGADIEPIYGRTLFFTTQIKKLGFSGSGVPVKFKFKIINEISQPAASYDGNLDGASYELKTDPDNINNLSLDVPKVISGGGDDRFTILPYDNNYVVGFCDDLDPSGTCHGSFGDVTSHVQGDSSLKAAIDFDTQIKEPSGALHKATRLVPGENRIEIKRRENVVGEGGIFVLVRLRDVRTNTVYLSCVRVRVVDEGASALGANEIANNLKNLTVEIPTVKADGTMDESNKQTIKPIKAAAYDSMMGSDGIRYAMINLDISNYMQALLATGNVTPQQLAMYSSSAADLAENPMMKYGITIKPTDIYNITRSGDVAGFDIPLSECNRVFVMDASIYASAMGGKSIVSNEFYLAWMVDSVDMNIHILPLKTTKYMTAAQKNANMTYIPYGNGAGASDLPLAIISQNGSPIPHSSTGRWLKFGFSIDNVAPETASIKDVSTIFAEKSEINMEADPSYFPANTVKLIASGDGYNSYAEGVKNNNLHNLPKEFVLDVYDYINDADVYRSSIGDLADESKKGYDTLRFDVEHGNSQIPGWQSTPYGNKIAVYGSNDNTNWYTWAQLKSQNIGQVRYIKFVAQSNVDFLATVVVADSSGKTTMGKFTISVIDSKPVYKDVTDQNSGYIYEIQKGAALGNELYRDVVLKNYMTLRTNPLTDAALGTNGQYLTTYAQWLAGGGLKTDYDKALNDYKKEQSLDITDFVVDPDGDSLKVATSTKDGKKVIPLNILATGIGGTGTDSAVFYAQEAGSLGEYEATISYPTGTSTADGSSIMKDIFYIKFNIMIDRISVKALSTYAGVIDIMFPIVSESEQDGSFDEADPGAINSYYGFKLRLLNSKPLVNNSVLTGGIYQAGTSFRFGTGSTFAEGTIKDYVTDVDFGDMFHIVPPRTGNYEGTNQGNIQIGVATGDFDQSGQALINWLSLDGIDGNATWLRYDTDHMTSVTKPEDTKSFTGLSVGFSDNSGISIAAYGAMRNQLYLKFYVTNFSLAGEGSNTLSGNRENAATEIVYSFTVTGSDVTSKIPTDRKITLAQYNKNTTIPARGEKYYIEPTGVSKGYVRIPIDDIALASGATGFYFTGDGNSVSYTQLFRNLIESNQATAYLDTEKAIRGYYVVKKNGEILKYAEDAAIVFYVDENSEKSHEIWIKPRVRTTDEGFSLTLRLAGGISSEGKNNIGSSDWTYGDKYSDIKYQFTIENFDFNIASEEGNHFEYSHPTFNRQHEGITLSANLVDYINVDSSKKLFFKDINGNFVGYDSTETHARMYVNLFSNTFAGRDADVNDIYYLKVDAKTTIDDTFIVVGVETPSNPAIHVCTKCNATWTGAVLNCLTQDCPNSNGESTDTYYTSFKITPDASKLGKGIDIGFSVMDFMIENRTAPDGSVTKEIFTGGIKTFTISFTCADAPEYVKEGALQAGEGENRRTRMDINGEYVYDLTAAGAKVACPNGNSSQYHGPDGTFDFCDGMYHYKKVNYVIDNFDANTAGMGVYLSDIFADSDLTLHEKKFDEKSIVLNFYLKTKAGVEIGNCLNKSLSTDGSTTTFDLKLNNGGATILQVIITTEQKVSIRLVSRTGIEQYDDEGGIMLDIAFGQKKDIDQTYAHYNVLVKTGDNPMLVRQTDLNIGVPYDTTKNNYSSRVNVDHIAYDFNDGDVPTLPVNISSDVTNPRIDITYTSPDNGTNILIRSYIDLKATPADSENNQVDYIFFAITSFHSDKFAKTDLYGNNVYSCRPLVQVKRNGELLETASGMRTPDEMRPIRFIIDKNEIKLNASLDQSLKYADGNTLKTVKTGNSFDLFSAGAIALHDPVYTNNGYRKIVVPEADKKKLNATDSIMQAFVIANFSEGGEKLHEMIYFNPNYKVYLMDSAKSETEKVDVSSSNYVGIRFNENAYAISGSESYDLQGNVKMTVTAQSPIIQNVAKTKYLRLVVSVSDLYGNTLLQNIDFVTSNSDVTINTAHTDYNELESKASNKQTFTCNLRSAEMAWGEERPSDAIASLPSYSYNGLSIANMLSDKDVGSYYNDGVVSTYNSYKVKVAVDGSVRYFVPYTKTPSSDEVNTLYLMRPGKGGTVTMSANYDPNNSDTRFAAVKMTEAGQFLIYPIRSTAAISKELKYFEFNIEEYVKQDSDLGLTYGKAGSSDLTCRFFLNIPDSKPTEIAGANKIITLKLGETMNINMEDYVYDYDGDPVAISKIDYYSADRDNSKYIEVPNAEGDSFFSVRVIKKFLNEQSLVNSGVPHFDMKLRVYFKDSTGEETGNSCEFTLKYENNAPTFVATDDNDPDYRYALNGTELTLTYKNSDKSQAGQTVLHSLSSFIRDADFPGTGVDANGEAVGESITVTINDVVTTHYSIKEFDDFIRQEISADSSVGTRNAISFKVSDSSNAKPVYKDTQVHSIKIIVETSNTAPYKAVNKDNIIGEVVIGRANTFSPTGSATYPLAGDINKNDKLYFEVPTKTVEDPDTGEITEVPDEMIYQIFDENNPNEVLVKIYHVAVNGIYDGSTIKVEVSSNYQQDMIEINTTLSVRDSHGGLVLLDGLRIAVTLPPEDALISPDIKTDVDKNKLVAFKGIPMKFTTDVASGVPSGSSEFNGDTMLFNIENLFQSKYVGRITLLSILPGTGYTVDAENKLVTVNKDYTDETITIEVEFETGGVRSIMSVDCAVSDPKGYTFGSMPSINANLVPTDSTKTVSIKDLVNDPHNGNFKFASVMCNNPKLLTVSIDGDNIVLIPHKAGEVTITIIVVDVNNENRFYEHTYSIALAGYPEISVWDTIMDNPWYIAAICCGIAVILIIVIVIVVKAAKKKKLMKELETMLLAEMDADEQLKLSGGNDIPMLGSGSMMQNGMYLGAGSQMPQNQMYLNAGMGGSQMNPNFGQSQMYDPNAQFSAMPGQGMDMGQSQMYDPNQFAGQSQMMNQGYGSQMMNQGYGNSQMYDPNQFGQSQMNNPGNPQQPGGGNDGGFFDLNDYNNFNR